VNYKSGALDTQRDSLSILQAVTYEHRHGAGGLPGQQKITWLPNAHRKRPWGRRVKQMRFAVRRLLITAFPGAKKQGALYI